MNIVEHVSLLPVGTSSGYMPRRGIVETDCTTMSSFLRNNQTDFQSGCISLQSHQQWRSVPLSPHPCQRLLDTGTERLPGTGFFRSPSVPRVDPVPQSYIHKYHQERAGLPGVPTNLQVHVRPPLFFKFLAQEGPSQSYQDTGS